MIICFNFAFSPVLEGRVDFDAKILFWRIN